MIRIAFSLLRWGYVAATLLLQAQREYTQVCKLADVQPLQGLLDVQGLCVTLADSGLLKMRGKQELPARRMQLSIDIDDAVRAMQSHPLCASLLQPASM